MSTWNFKYDILEQTGRTPFGTLNRGCNLEQQSEVEILEISPHLREDKATFEDVWNTVIASSKTVHDLLVPVIDVDKSRGWVIMERRGDSLETVLQRGKLSFNAVRTLLREMLGLLSFFEEKKHIHGDIQPAMLLLPFLEGSRVEDRRVKLSFSPGVSICGEIPITHRESKYLAPEMINHEFGPLGSAADRYCLAFTALELLVGPDFDRHFARVGQDRDTLWYTWHGNLSEKMPTPRELLPGLDDDLNTLLSGMLQKHVADRPVSAKDALKLLLETEPERVVPTGATPVVQPGELSVTSQEQIASDFTTYTPPLAAAVSTPPPTKSKPIARSGDGPAPWSKDWMDEQVKKPWIIALLVIVFFVPAILLGLALQQPTKKQTSKEETSAQTVKAEEEAAQNKAAEEAAAKKKAEEEATQRKVAERAAARKKTEEEAAQRKVAEDAAAKKKAEEDAERLYQEGNELFEQYDFEKAIGKYDLALKKKPDLFKALAKKGKTEFEIGRYTESQANLEKAIKELAGSDQKTELADAYCTRSRLWRMRGNWKELEKDLNDALRVDNRYGEAYQRRASYWRQAGNKEKADADYEAAQKCFEEQLKDDPKGVNALLRLGGVLAARKNFTEAAATFAKAEEISPKNIGVHLAKANMFRQQKEYAKAVESCRQVIEWRKDLPFAHRLLGMILLDQEQFDAAVAEFVTVASLTPESPTGNRMAGEARLAEGKIDDALEFFAGALAIHSSDPFALVGRGECFVRKSEENEAEREKFLESALKDFDASIGADIDPARAYFNRGKVRALLGQTNTALSDFQKATEIDPDSANAFINLGLMKSELGDAPGAILALNQAVELSSEDQRSSHFAHYNRGLVLAQDGKHREAVDDFNKALGQGSNIKDVLYHRAVSQKALGDRKEAMDSCDAAIKLDDRFAEALFLRGMIAFEQRSDESLRQAETDLSRAIEIRPPNDLRRAEYHYVRGMLYGFLNRNENAQKDFTESLRLDAENSRYKTALEKINERIGKAPN